MGQLIGGVCYLKVNGRQLSLRGDLKVSVQGFVRTGVAGQDKVHGFTEAPAIPYIEGAFTTLPGGIAEAELHAMTNVTVTAELKNGKAYVLRNAWTANAREIDVVQGQVTIRWEGEEGEELK